jgi:DNA polymerase-3 subunit delta
MVPPVYLYTGPEFGERNDAVLAVKASMKKKFGSLDEYLYYAPETTVGDAVAVLQSGSLFTAATCVVLRGAENIKTKSEMDLLASWISSVSAQKKAAAALVLVSDEISVDSRVEKLVPKENRHIFWELFEDRKQEWLQSFFRKAGYQLQPEAADTILDLVENNTEALRTECGRFFLCFPEGREITAADVENILAHNREESAFTLFDVMSDFRVAPQKRLENALEVLQKIRLSKNSSAVMLIAGLTSCFRRLAFWHGINAKGMQPDDSVLKAGGFTSRKARTQYRSAAQVWTAGQTAAITALLGSADINIRSGGSALEETLLQVMLYAVIMKNGAFCSVYESTIPV